MRNFINAIKVNVQIRRLPRHYREYYFRTINTANQLTGIMAHDINEAKSLWQMLDQAQHAIKRCLELDIDSIYLFSLGSQLQRIKSGLRSKYRF